MERIRKVLQFNYVWHIEQNENLVCKVKSTLLNQGGMEMKIRKLSCVLLVVTMFVFMTGQSFAYETMTQGYYKKELLIKKSSSFDSSYGTPATNAASDWTSELDEARTIKITTNADNIIESEFYGVSWRGLYSPSGHSGGSNNTATSFVISINSSAVGDASANVKRGVIAHEMGHALGLQHPSSTNVLMSPNRDEAKIYKPQSDDINGAKKQAGSISSKAINPTSFTEKGKLYFNFPFYQNEEELFMAADVIVSGEIIGESFEAINVCLDPSREKVLNYKVYELQVSNIEKGNLMVGESVFIKQEVDEDDYTNYAIGDVGTFTLLDFSSYGLHYSLVNPTQGYRSI